MRPLQPIAQMPAHRMAGSPMLYAWHSARANWWLEAVLELGWSDWSSFNSVLAILVSVWRVRWVVVVC